MKHCKKTTRYVSILVVLVPDVMALIDMLRYDSCCPSTEDESRKLQRLLGNHAKPEDHVIRLRRLAASDIPATVDRWSSFGCRVLDERSPDAEQLTDHELIRMLKGEH